MAEAARRVTIINELGLHARAASKLVQVASSYPVELSIGREDMMVNSKSIMGVLMLAAARGTELSVIARGDDAQLCHDAADAVCRLIEERFGEER